MRTSARSIGLGLVAMMGAVGCSAVQSTSSAAGGAASASDPGADDGTSTSTDPNSPSGTPKDASDPEAPQAPLVTGLSITEVAVFQGVKIDVVKDGKSVSSRNAPVVAGRPALVRAYVKPEPTWKSRAVTAELRLVAGTTKLPLLHDTKTITAESSDTDPESAFDFEVPAGSLPAGVTYQVALTAKDGVVPTGTSSARFPGDGTLAALGARPSGKLKIVVVPVQYMADGSGRVPDVTAAQLELYKQTMMARYPATDVEVTARAPYSYSSTISANGSGFDTVLTAVRNLRRADGVASDVYYFGALAPASTFATFCRGGCVTGLGTVVDSPSSASFRAAVGVGYSGQDSADTMAHEIGHTHGREHAPCGGAQSTDPQFPYAGGTIGVLGYNILTKTFMSPSKGHDFMGYCDNDWVSDYTYSALFDRISSLNGGTASSTTGGSAGAGASVFRVATVAADGSLAWTTEVETSEPVGGHPREVTFVAASGQSLGTHTARFYPYDHLPGGVLVVPSGPASKLPSSVKLDSVWATARVSGFTSALPR